MFSDLREIGLVPNKSNIIEFPSTIPNKYLSCFIRGYFDGDGSITPRGNIGMLISFTSGSLSFLESLSKTLSSELQIKQQKIYNSHRSYQLCYRTNESLRVLDFMYQKKLDGLYLHYKYKIYRELFKKRIKRYGRNMVTYPSGLRGRSAKPLFVGSNPTVTS